MPKRNVRSKSVPNRKRSRSRTRGRSTTKKVTNNSNNVRKPLNQLAQNVRVRRKEILGSGSFTQDSNLSIKHHIFDAANGPAWFKKMCDLFEKYKMHSVDIEVVFGGSKMTKGVYILSYNTNYDQRNDNTATQSQLAAQKGAIQVPASNQIGRLHINGSGLTGYSTTLPTTGNQSYCFDAIIAGVPAEDVSYTINVIYDVTFYNPQLTD